MTECLGPFEHLEIERQERVLTIAFNRPDRLNAFNARLHAELADAIRQAATDTGSDVIVLTGRGKAFSAGGDIEWQQGAARDPTLFEATVREAKQIVFGMIDCEKPIIARINGPAVGLGATIALFCDVSFIDRSAYLSDPHVNIGMVAGDGGALIWPQLIGYARAKHYLFTGSRIDAEEAHRIGLVTFVVSDDGLDQAVRSYCEQLLAMPQLALRYTKVTANIPLRALAAPVMDTGLGYESVTNVSADHREALAAFREKRAPRLAQS